MDWLLPIVADTPVGASGIVRGVIAGDAVDTGEVPARFSATTVKVYDVPLDKPVTVQEVAPEVVQVFAPGDEVTVKPVIGEPPFEAGTLHEIAASVFPGVATTLVGASGIVRGVIAVDARDEAELPAALSATTVKVYAVPLANPEKVHERLVVLVQSAGAATAGNEVTV